MSNDATRYIVGLPNRQQTIDGDLAHAIHSRAVDHDHAFCGFDAEIGGSLVIECSDEFADDLRGHDAIRYVEADQRDRAEALPDDGHAASQEVPWGIERVRATDLIDQGITGEGVTVGVLDTGVAAAHPDLSVAGGRDYAGENPRAPPAWDDPNDHGTHVAGTIAAAHNDKGVLGGAPGVTLRGYRVLGTDGWGNRSDIVAAIHDAVEDGCDMLNMSLSGSGDSQSYRDAFRYTAKNGVVVCAAAGNTGKQESRWPAANDGTLGVGASTPDDTMAEFSTRGEHVDVVAPGVGVKSTVPGGYADGWGGTSMATPLVSACLALLVSEGHDPQAAVDALEATARDIGAPGTAQGAGVVDVVAALERLNTMSQRNRDGHIVAIEGHGPRVNYGVGAGRLWAVEARGGRVNPDDTVTGEPGSGEMEASGHVTGGVDPFGYHGTRSLSLELEDGSVPTTDEVTVWVKPKGKEWIDWTEETLANQQPEQSGGPTIEERKARLKEPGRATEIGEITSAQGFADAFEFRGEFIDGDLGYVLADGEYNARDADKSHPSGAFHSTFIPAIPSYSVKFVGNWEDPTQVHVESNVALIDLAYDEHVKFVGVQFEGLQVSRGDAWFEDCIIHDLGGKPAHGRFNDCVIGSQDADRAGRWYGGGQVYFDYDTTIESGGEAYFTVPNNCTLQIRGSVEFSDPDKPLFDDGRSITPADLGSGINELPPDHDASVYS